MFNCMFINGALNTILKSIFKVPLDISLNNQCWWSFPSGHMQYGIVLYGMLWINSNFNLKLLWFFIGLLILSAFAINYNQYHTYLDMIAAIPPAAAILYLYYVVYSNGFSLMKINILSIIFQTVIVFNIEYPCIGYKLNWMYLNLGVNVGFLITLFLHNHDAFHMKRKIKFNKLRFLLLLIASCVFQYFITALRTIDLNLIYGIFFPLILFFISKLRNP